MSQIKGRGSVVPLEAGKPRARCRKWRLVVDMGVDPVSKKRRPPKTRRFPSREERASGIKGTYSEAQEALRKFIAELDSGILCGDRTTMAGLAEAWMDARRKEQLFGNLSAGTIRKDEVRARTISRWMGKALVRDVKSDTVSDFYVAMLSGEASLSGRPLTGTTARGVAVALGSMMRMAVKSKLIAESPCDGLGKPKADTEEKEALAVDQMRALVVDLLAGQPDGHMVGVLLAMTCGLSREELLGLTWGCVENGVLRIVKAKNVDDPGLADTKTPARRRIIPLHPRVIEALDAWSVAQAARLAVLRIKQGDSTPIVTSAVGGHVHPENFARWWRTWRDRHGLEGVGLHQLRHTFATYLLAEGADMVTAADLMGHSSTKMLDDVYAHTVPGRRVEAMIAVGDYMFESGIPSGIPECSALKYAGCIE